MYNIIIYFESDYIIKKSLRERITPKEGRQNQENIMLSINCFKSMCTMVRNNTKKKYLKIHDNGIPNNTKRRTTHQRTRRKIQIMHQHNSRLQKHHIYSHIQQLKDLYSFIKIQNLMTTATSDSTQLSNNNLHIFKLDNDKSLELKGINIITRKEDGFINASQLCQAGNKLWNDYFRTKNTIAYLEVIKR